MFHSYFEWSTFKTSCFEKVTVCVIETMLIRKALVQMNSGKGSEPTNQSQTKINSEKGFGTNLKKASLINDINYIS